MSKFTKAVISDTTGAPVSLTGSSLNVNVTGGGAGGGAVTVADGVDVAEGATTDAAVVSDVSGTVSGKLRGLVKILASVWDSVNGRLKVDASATTVTVSNSGLTNIDVALSTRLKPADTLAGITTIGTITNPVSVNQGTAGSTDWRSDLRRGLTISFAAINVSASGDNTVVAADATRKIKVLQYTLIGAGAVNVTLKSGAGTSLSGAMSLAANGGIATPFVAPAEGHLVETAINQALVFNLSSAVSVTGHMVYILEA